MELAAPPAPCHNLAFNMSGGKLGTVAAAAAAAAKRAASVSRTAPPANRALSSIISARKDCCALASAAPPPSASVVFAFIVFNVSLTRTLLVVNVTNETNTTMCGLA